MCHGLYSLCSTVVGTQPWILLTWLLVVWRRPGAHFKNYRCARGYILMECSLNNLLRHLLPRFVDEGTGSGRLSDIPSVCSRSEGVKRCTWLSLLPPCSGPRLPHGQLPTVDSSFHSPSRAPVVGGFGSISPPDPPSPWTSTRHLSPLSPGKFIFLLRGAVVQPCPLHVWFHGGHH